MTAKKASKEKARMFSAERRGSPNGSSRNKRNENRMRRPGWRRFACIRWLGKIMTLNEWKKSAERGTSGDMVWSILSDWERDVATLRKAATEAARVFRHYEFLHQQKGTEDGLVKSQANAAKAEMLERALMPNVQGERTMPDGAARANERSESTGRDSGYRFARPLC